MMKKTSIFLICLSIILCSLAGCANSRSKDSLPAGTEISSDCTESHTVESDGHADPWYENFKNNVSKNPYDAWLDTQKSEGIRTEKAIYAEYLALWQNEMDFTVEYGKEVFEDPSVYEAWKHNIEQWVEVEKNTLMLEMNVFDASLQQLEAIIPRCMRFRQKVIDEKKFLYYYEIVKSGDPVALPPIPWLTETVLEPLETGAFIQ